MTCKDLFYDIKINRRETEDSRRVVTQWNIKNDPYLPTIPDKFVDEPDVVDAYYAITAERLLYRGKVLGKQIDEKLDQSQGVRNARPFGPQGPTYAELSAPKARIAAALVPLIPCVRDNAAPVLARLYCVAGIHRHFKTPLEEGWDTTGLDEFDWFVAGVRSDQLSLGIKGRSWLLAAHLLMRVQREKDKAVTSRLVGNFIVTGDVRAGALIHVENIRMKMGLASRNEFKSLTWIIPGGNKKELDVSMLNRTTCPENLDQAYAIVKGHPSSATRLFWKYLEEATYKTRLNLLDLQDCADDGADLFSEKNGKSPIQVIAERIEQLRLEITALEVLSEAEQVLKDNKWETGPDKNIVSDSVDTLCRAVSVSSEKGTKNSSYHFFEGSCLTREANVSKRLSLNKRRALRVILGNFESVKWWLESKGANAAKTFVTLAKSGMKGALEELASRIPINSKDEKGLTAIDWALIMGEYDAAHLLYAVGGSIDAKGLELQIVRNMCGIMDPYQAGERLPTIISTALAVGLDPEGTALFFNGLLEGDVGLVSACLEAGCDPNAPFSGYCGSVSSKPNPIFIAAENIFDEEKRQAIIDLLRAHGVSEENVSERELKHAKARSFVNFNQTKEIVKALEEGVLSPRERFINWDDGDEDQERGNLDHRNVILLDSCYMETAEVKHRSIESLFVRALRLGWLDVIEWCLKNGVSPVAELNREHKGYKDYPFSFDVEAPAITVVDEENEKKSEEIVEKKYPAEFVVSFHEEEKKETLSLLRRYIPQDVTCPERAMP